MELEFLHYMMTMDKEAAATLSQSDVTKWDGWCRGVEKMSDDLDRLFRGLGRLVKVAERHPGARKRARRAYLASVSP